MLIVCYLFVPAVINTMFSNPD